MLTEPRESLEPLCENTHMHIAHKHMSFQLHISDLVQSRRYGFSRLSQYEFIPQIARR